MKKVKFGEARQIYIEQISKYFLKHIGPVKLPADYGFCWGNHVYPFYISVRAMQYILDTSITAKIPDDLVHKLSFDVLGIEFQCL